MQNIAFNELLDILVNHKKLFLDLGLVFLVTIIINFLTVKLLNYASAQASKTKSIWDDILFYSISKPLKFFIWFIALSYMIQIASNDLSVSVGDDSVIHLLEQIRNILFVLLMVWFLNRFISEAEKKVTHIGKSHLDPTSAKIGARILNSLVFICAFIIVMQTVGIKVSNFLTFGLAGTIVLGLGAKDMLSNFAGGFMIYFDRPFVVGDWIRSSDREIEGTVEYIGWRLTRIRTFSRSPIYIPNAVFSSITIENPSRMTNRRIKTNFGLRYQDSKKVPAILAEIKQMLTEHDGIADDRLCIVNLVDFGPSSLVCTIYCFTKAVAWSEYQDVQQDVFMRVLQIVEQHGAEIALPISTVRVPEPIYLENK